MFWLFIQNKIKRSGDFKSVNADLVLCNVARNYLLLICYAGLRLAIPNDIQDRLRGLKNDSKRNAKLDSR